MKGRYAAQIGARPRLRARMRRRERGEDGGRTEHEPFHLPCFVAAAVVRCICAVLCVCGHRISAVGSDRVGILRRTGIRLPLFVASLVWPFWDVRVVI